VVELPFDAICVKGAIFFWKSYKFSDGEQQDKFVVVLSKDNSLDPILLTLTTSQLDNYQRIKRLYLEVYVIKKGEYSWFYKDTLLDFSKIIEHNKAELSLAYQQGTLEYRGVLKDNHLKEIEDIIYRSEIIEEEKIERIV
jgi:hypothetical protein